ncbi:unnamed protein product [Rhodiola kirilowii]
MSSLRLSFLAHPKSPKTPILTLPYRTQFGKLPRCSLSVIAEPTDLEASLSDSHRPLPAENSRTIMELSSVGTLSTISNGGWPLGLGVQFAVDSRGTPVLCLNDSYTRFFGDDMRASFHVQLDQCKIRTPQCTIQGSLSKPEDMMLLKLLREKYQCSMYLILTEISFSVGKRFGKVNADLLYVVNIDRVLQVENFKEAGVWVTPTDYKNAMPDPLRDIAEKIVNEINYKNVEDVFRFCNVYADLDFQVLDAKVIWLDRLGFDLRLSSQKEVYEVRIPFTREVIDEKGAKSSFNCMSQLAWEMEKNYSVPEFSKVTQLKLVS